MWALSDVLQGCCQAASHHCIGKNELPVETEVKRPLASAEAGLHRQPSSSSLGFEPSILV